MYEEKSEMIKALKQWTIPELERRGFIGKFPHYRRLGKTKIDLLMFQFDKLGGGFIIEILYALTEGKDNNLIFDSVLLPEKVTVAETNIRHRLCPKQYGWFYYYDIVQIKSSKNNSIIPVKPIEKQSFIDSSKKVIKWLQIADDAIYEKLAKEALNFLPEAEAWWNQMPHQSSLNKVFKQFFSRVNRKSQNL